MNATQKKQLNEYAEKTKLFDRISTNFYSTPNINNITRASKVIQETPNFMELLLDGSFVDAAILHTIPRVSEE